MDRTTAAWGAALVVFACGLCGLAWREAGPMVAVGFASGWCAALGALVLAIAAW